MANKKNFVNPLTRSSEEELHIAQPSTNTSTFTSTQQQESSPPEFQAMRKRGDKAFEKTHRRFTGWMDKNLKEQFEKLAQDKGVSKTSLLNESIADLLRKYMQK